MSVPQAALPLLLLLLITGCDRGAGQTEATPPPAATTSWSTAAPPPPGEAPAAQVTAAPAEPVVADKPTAKPAAQAQPPRPPAQSAAAAPSGPAAPADEHAGHDHPAGDAKAAPGRTDDSAGTSGAAADAVYTCPMHPDVKAKAPGRCPDCGMDLVLKK